MHDFTRTYQSYAITGWEGGNVGPHSLTERSSYTVPSERFLVIQNCWLYMMRVTAATTVGIYYLKIGVLLGGVTECTLIQATSRDNTVGAVMNMVLPNQIYLRPGDVIKTWTADTSTGGAVNYAMVLLLTTYL